MLIMGNSIRIMAIIGIKFNRVVNLWLIELQQSGGAAFAGTTRGGPRGGAGGKKERGHVTGEAEPPVDHPEKWAKANNAGGRPLFVIKISSLY